MELLDAIVGYLTTHGVAELSLRPLAKAVGSSPRVLLYYFVSKEEMVVKALARLRERQRTTYNQMKAASFDSPSEACRAIWRHMSAPDSEPLFRLFFEAYVLALRHPQRFRDFLHTAIEDWLEFLAAPLCHKGYGQSEARAFATIVLAGFRASCSITVLPKTASDWVAPWICGCTLWTPFRSLAELLALIA